MMDDLHVVNDQQKQDFDLDILKKTIPNSESLAFCLREELPVGLEPTTCALQVRCAAVAPQKHTANTGCAGSESHLNYNTPSQAYCNPHAYGNSLRRWL